MLCKNFNDVMSAIKNKKLGIILSFEGVEPLYNGLNLLKIFYKLGVRGLGLSWSRRNYAADGCHYTDVPEGHKGGLTDFGFNLIKEAEKLGMLIDVSHLNDEGFDDVLKFTKNPFIASHSNSRALSNIKRNLTDFQIKAIANRGGIICVNASSIMVADNDEDSNAEYLAKHIDYIVNLAGIDHVGFGFDFCDRFEESGQIYSNSRISFDVIKGHGEVNKVLKILSNRGYNSKDIEKIGCENYLRVLDNVINK
ncbi:dipeptidase [Clostridium aromativorans]|nr:membrane dipeptidase [Clostridium aromativorans]